MISRISCILLLSSLSLTATAAFAPQLPLSKRQFDDFSSQSVGNGDTPDTDGEALVKEFYQQLRDREQDQEKQERDQEEQQQELKLSEQEACRLLNRKAFSRRGEVQAE